MSYWISILSNTHRANISEKVWKYQDTWGIKGAANPGGWPAKLGRQIWLKTKKNLIYFNAYPNNGRISLNNRENVFFLFSLKNFCFKLGGGSFLGNQR